MPAIHHTLLLVVHILYVGLLCSPHLVSHVLATPIPAPMPLGFSRYYDGSLSDLAPPLVQPRDPKNNHTLHGNQVETSRAHALYTPSPSLSQPGGVTSKVGRQLDDDSILNNINLLNVFYEKASQNAGTLHTYSAQATSGNGGGKDINSQYASELQSLQTNTFGFESILAELGADKGLANYDRTNDIETVLKELVNLHKEVLSDTTEFAYAVPAVGPILGPIVYQIKCLIDEILDATENLSDATINALQPTLKALIGGYSTLSCRSGVEVVGLCI